MTRVASSSFSGATPALTETVPVSGFRVRRIIRQPLVHSDAAAERR